MVPVILVPVIFVAVRLVVFRVEKKPFVAFILENCTDPCNFIDPAIRFRLSVVYRDTSVRLWVI